MVGAFLYLTGCSFKNRLRRRLQRLREPRYVAGLIVGLLYFYFAFFRRHRTRRPVDDLPTLAALAAPVQLVASLFLFAAAAIGWVWPSGRPPLPFTRAEVQFLFTAPVTRRQLVHYKLWRSQIAILFGSAIATLILRPGSLAGGWMLLAGIWVVLMTLRLHLMGVALRRLSLASHGALGVARQWLPLVVVVGAVGVLAKAIVDAWPVLASLTAGDAILAELQRRAGQGAVSVVLWPFQALVRLPAAASPAAFWSALPAALALLAVNYVWVLRSDAAFEEASAEHAERQAAARPASRAVVKGAAATPFTLGPEGPAETAILWKNLILVGRYVSLRTLLRLLPLAVVFGLLARDAGSGGIAAAISALCLPLAAFVVLMGPQIMRNDLRQDLARLPLLKTWPMRGAVLIRGEVLAPAVVVTAVAWLLLLAAGVFGGEIRSGTAGAVALPAHRASYIAAAFVLAPALVLSQVVVQNGLAVLFPAWSAIGETRARGIDAMGQRMLLLGGMLLALVVSLVPGIVVAGAFAFAAYLLTGTIMLVAPAFIVSAIVLGECWLAIEGLGRVLDRTDPSAVEAAE
jgi:ABC-2 type transport system permease protein